MHNSALIIYFLIIISFTSIVVVSTMSLTITQLRTAYEIPALQLIQECVENNLPEHRPCKIHLTAWPTSPEK